MWKRRRRIKIRVRCSRERREERWEEMKERRSMENEPSFYEMRTCFFASMN
jgi:hypothetical protein